MRKLTVGIIDILGKSTSRKGYSRYMRANFSSVMPQVVAVWCAELGHDVHMCYYDGPEVIAGGLPDDVDIIFMSAFSQTAQLAYALSNFYQSKGAVTVLGGPHPRSYPDDAIKYFDYAVGFCDKDLVRDILQDCSAHRPRGQYLTTSRQLTQLPGVRQRWPFIESILDAAKILKMVPVLGSLGCPYTCSFCTDATVAYQPLDFETLKDDLRFIQSKKIPRSMIAWHDPNFGIRFNQYLDAIEEAVAPGSLRFIAEMSLSLLKEENVKRLAHNGFKVLLPGIESWFDVGDKSMMRNTRGMEKVRRVADHCNMIMSYIPYLSTNFVFGLDADEGPEPFELTKRFVDLAPGAYLYNSLLTSYGRSAPDNLHYQRDGRVLNIPFHFLNTVHAMNVRPKNYEWPAFFDHVIEVFEYSFSAKAMRRRLVAKGPFSPMTRVEKFVRGISAGRNHRCANMRSMRKRFDEVQGGRYFAGETTTLPDFFVDPVRNDLRWLWEWLPEGALYHDPNTYLKSLNGKAARPTEAHAGKVTPSELSPLLT